MTTWTQYSPVSTDSWVQYIPTSTDTWYQLEPWQGFGQNPFGDDTSDKGIAIHQRGFGDPTTKWTQYSGG